MFCNRTLGPFVGLLAFLNLGFHAVQADERDARILDYLAQPTAGKIEQVQAMRDEIVVVGHTGPGPGPFVVEEVPAHMASVDWRRTRAQVEVDRRAVEPGPFRVRFPRTADGRDRILSRWGVRGPNGEPTTALRWADDLTAAALRPELKKQTPTSKKGMGAMEGVTKLDDLVELGVRNVTLNVPLQGLLEIPAGDGLRHTYAGRDYTFHRGAVDQYDRLLQFAHRHDMVVSLILLVPRLPRDTPLGTAWTHPDAASGPYSLANVVEPLGVETYAATIHFLADRYTRPDAPFGRATHWIVHNEVDAAWEWTNAGEKTLPRFMEDYTRSLRVVDLTVRSFDPHAQVFVSLTHHWAQAHHPSPTRSYPSRAVLESLLDWCRVEGDFAWGVAYHPYPQNLLDPRTWRDDQAQFHFQTPKITFKNLEVLDAWMRLPSMLRNGRPRTVLLSEQGFHTPGSDAASLELQAAALAYAWRKLSSLSTIESFHYHRWTDHSQEGGLLCGLWTHVPGTVSTPHTAKPSWSLYRSLSTPSESSSLLFALPLIGLPDWSSLKPQPVGER